MPYSALPSAVVAQAAATMGAFAPGRFYLGLGTGEALNEYAATGQWPDYEIRQQQMIEAVQLIRALWSGEPVSHHGQYYQTRQARRYMELGFDHLIFHSAGPDQRAFIEGYGRDVLPKLRAA
jgi:coenzyme F420-dependent glucose-6-phosphate dehydrogenase